MNTDVLNVDRRGRVRLPAPTSDHYMYEADDDGIITLTPIRPDPTDDVAASVVLNSHPDAGSGMTGPRPDTATLDTV